ncbi:hypothetical protein [Ferrovibrio xuzhouensis]|uniref:Uncharacterized protein n=1 Tax=Ferrovibrio xuzhouensis TaxID=1576914 RepID=A0ABV7VD20_9PROT
MTVTYVRVAGVVRRLAVIIPPHLEGGTPVWDEDQRPATVMSDIGAYTLIRRHDNSFVWRPRRTLTERWLPTGTPRVDMVFDHPPCPAPRR